MTTRAPEIFGESGNILNLRQYFPSAMARYTTPDIAIADEPTPYAAEYFPLISVAYTWFCADREADQLATGFKRRNDGPWQSPKAEERASACRAGTDACSARRWPRSEAGRVGSPARSSCRARGIRGADEGTPHDALLMSQGSAL